MDPIVGVRLMTAGDLLYCSPGDLNLMIGDYVVLVTDRGERIGRVVVTPDQIMTNQVSGPLRVISRLATEADLTTQEKMKKKAADESNRAQECAASVDSRIRVADLTYDLTETFLEISYVLPDKVQVKHDNIQQAFESHYSESLQLNRIGDRDRAKLTGGFGVCGRELCCSSWMTTFPSISMKLAKEQGLSPNPSKISGVCGRLLCCLTFEVDAYREIAGTLPKVGKTISTPAGRAKVLSINYLSETVRLYFKDQGETIQLTADELRAQMGTTVRPVELEEEVEETVRKQEEERGKNFLGVLTPVDTPPHRDNSSSKRDSARRAKPQRDSNKKSISSSKIARRRPAGSKESTESSPEPTPRKRPRRRGRRVGRRTTPSPE